ncbi:hypothetical protein MMF93_07730 [Streptomyces tubbatahanensis]|uniref:PH domain-containing protein n=1 Tax=Streptomyces tubbatahanensis TaxID=2923272 RepID=A0ABY3XPR0_9ACTN|nr:hypothetical protein [Streptomyces tubbatahanensis]UNS96406.1 hypothetical protein MMF93_07730 [Streptomyces tubbatahanensis]
MAFRKATMKKQVAEAIAQQAPGDQPLVSVGTVAGPTPWLSVGFLGLIGQFLIKYYFITVTEQALLFHRMSRFSQRPKEIVHAIPREQAHTLFGEIQLNPLWSFYYMALPGEAKQVRINVHRMWRNELEQLLALVNGAAGPQGYAQPQQAYAPPQQGYAPQPQQAAPQAPPQGQQYAQPQQAPGGYQQPQAPQQQPGPYYGAPQNPGAPAAPPQQPPQPGPYYGNPGQQQGGAPVDPRSNPYG